MTAPVVREPAPRLGDLTLLAFGARVGALVVAAQQQDQAVVVRVAEHAQQDALVPRLVARGLAERSQDLPGMAQAELEQTVAELLAVPPRQTPIPSTWRISAMATPIARRWVGVSSSRNQRRTG